MLQSDAKVFISMACTFKFAPKTPIHPLAGTGEDNERSNGDSGYEQYLASSQLGVVCRVRQLVGRVRMAMCNSAETC